MTDLHAIADEIILKAQQNPDLSLRDFIVQGLEEQIKRCAELCRRK